MNRQRIVREVGLISLVLGLFALSSLCQEPKYVEGTQYNVIEWEMRLRVLEGLKEGAPAAPAVVTSSFLKYTFSANFQSPEDLAEEQGQIKRIFNLKDARLLTEGLLDWRIGRPERVDYVFRLDGKEYLVRVRGGGLNASPGSVASQTFGVEVIEIMTWETLKDKAEKGIPIVAKREVSLLDTEFTVSSLKNVTVFGFEDSQGKPYFISLRQTKMYADEAVVKRSGVKIGQVVSDIKPPKLVKQIDPVYPEIARQAQVSGVVVVEATIDVNGRVARVAVLKSIPLLDQAAVDAVRQWVYEPMIVDGQPRPVVLTTSVQFMLAKDKDGKVRGITGGATGGVEGGVEGKVVGWVDPAMLGGVEGGVQGGVEGGVVGGVLGGIPSQEQKEFEKDAVKATGEIKPPLLIKAVDPVYPEIARKAQVEGVVILEARTDEKGNVEDARILRSIPLLDQAAIDAVKQWKYERLIIDGKPRKVLFTVTVRFMLKSGDREKALEKFAQGAVKAEGAVKPPLLVKAVDPVYPEDARKAGVEGVVILSAKTDATGHVQDAMVLRSVPLLNKAAIDAVKQWVYEPYVQDGTPMPIVFTVTVSFQLDNKKRTGSSGVVVGGVLGGVGGQMPEGDLTGAVRIKDGIQPPKLVKEVEPVYPEIARQAQVEGVVILEATTDEDGNVAAVRILRSIPLLDQPAIEAVRQWKYEPLIIDGKRWKAIFTVTARFALTSGDKEKDLEKFSRGAVKAVGAINPPKLLKIVEPVYPGDAKKALIEGVVILSVKTDATGHVQDVMVLRSVPQLNKAAIDAVKQWVYEPYVQDGKPTPVVFTVTVRFENPDKNREKHETLTLKFIDADLRQVVTYIAGFVGLNVVFGPDVEGKVTCDFKDMPWDQALDLILRQNGMTKTVRDGTLEVARLREPI